MEFQAVTWNNLQRWTFELGQRLEKNNTFDYIVAISRGGLSIGHMLTDFLNVPIHVLNLCSYANYTQKQEVRLLDRFNADIQGRKILLVDDISDSGDSFIKAINIIRGKKPELIVTASIFIKPHTKFIPDFYCKKTNTWVVFPSEIRETIQGLFRMYTYPNVAEKQLKALGIKSTFIKYFGEKKL